MSNDESITPEITTRHGKYCTHRETEINAEQREVMCLRCGAKLDPISVLLTFARSRDQLRFTARRKLEEINKLQATVDDLKRQERNAKARMRRFKGLDAPTVEENEPNVIPLGRNRR